ncbi:chemotaxis protein CheW [Prochlorothrix hollandica]|uniref:chemotaxis protein CheW n=1 Tax=Prochlorothrix hollandica TaxID=1223 RepID=UPI003342737D
MGDHSCPLLVEAIHCQNCGVYGAAGRSLLQRVAPPGYVEEWIQILADGPESPDSGESRLDQSGVQQSGVQQSGVQKNRAQNRAMEKFSSLQSLILFRLGEECLACPVHLLQLVTTPTPIHRIPHRQNPAFLGLVNVRGELLLCVSLRVLLGIAPPHPEPGHGQPRWIVMGTTAQPWVVPVDEIYGIDRVAIHTLEEPPIVLGQETAAYSQGMIQWQGRRVNVLAGDRLLANLQVALT